MRPHFHSVNMLVKIYKSVSRKCGQRLETCAENVSFMAYFNFLRFSEEKGRIFKALETRKSGSLISQYNEIKR